MTDSNLNPHEKLKEASDQVMSVLSVLMLSYGHLLANTELAEDLECAINDLGEAIEAVETEG